MNGKLDHPGPAEDAVLRLGPRITVLPVLHGSGDCAVEVRRRAAEFDCDALAVPLPHSFRAAVEAAIVRLPRPAIVIQRQWDEDLGSWSQEDEEDEEESDEEDDDSPAFNYVPIDPCQPVIAAIRWAIEEHVPRHFIDLETRHFVPNGQVLPDPYALKMVSLERFAAALLPAIPRPREWQRRQRIRYMAHRLRELAIDHRRILLVCSILDWPWIREAYFEESPPWPEPESVPPVETHAVDPQTLYFLFGELPFITSLYERARSRLEDDRNLSIDGVKELLLAARDAYRSEFGSRARTISPLALRQCLQYSRNLTLLQGRLTPDLVTLVTAAKQIGGDAYALQVLETARRYSPEADAERPAARMGLGRATLPDRPDDACTMISRLPGPPVQLRKLELMPRPTEADRRRWSQSWDPFRQCSWPPEDERIESFRSAVFDRARQILGADLARTEKFTSSIKDGIDIRDTLRNWHENTIYVKELPPNRGDLDAAVMLFDSPADPRDYPWRSTWYAEHDQESTLAFYATDFRDQPVGPGICRAFYGGSLFLFPPLRIPDIWTDETLDVCETLEERLLVAACRYARSRHVALVSPLPPGPAWRQIARRFGKVWVHVPLRQFSEATLHQLRQMHVLNGRQVRSYAAHFIRRP